MLKGVTVRNAVPIVAIAICAALAINGIYTFIDHPWLTFPINMIVMGSTLILAYLIDLIGWG